MYIELVLCVEKHSGGGAGGGAGGGGGGGGGGNKNMYSRGKKVYMCKIR